MSSQTPNVVKSIYETFLFCPFHFRKPYWKFLKFDRLDKADRIWPPNFYCFERMTCRPVTTERRAGSDRLLDFVLRDPLPILTLHPPRSPMLNSSQKAPCLFNRELTHSRSLLIPLSHTQLVNCIPGLKGHSGVQECEGASVMPPVAFHSHPTPDC